MYFVCTILILSDSSHWHCLYFLYIDNTLLNRSAVLHNAIFKISSKQGLTGILLIFLSLPSLIKSKAPIIISITVTVTTFFQFQNLSISVYISEMRYFVHYLHFSDYFLIFVARFTTMFRPLYAPAFFRWSECRT